MSQTTLPDGLLSVSETEAEGEIAQLYAEMRASMGVPLVNLVWRHLAAIPGALDVTWSALKPLYKNGAILVQAQSLAANQPASDAFKWSQEQFAQAQLSVDDQAKIVHVLKVYERTNVLNLISAAALMAALNKVSHPPLELADAPHALEDLSAPLPNAPPVAILPQALQALLQDLRDLAGPSDIMPTLYRHLAHWPAFLALLYANVAPLQERQVLSGMASDILVQAHLHAAPLVGHLGPIEDKLDTEHEALVRGALQAFMRGPLAQMVGVAAIVRAAWPDASFDA